MNKYEAWCYDEVCIYKNGYRISIFDLFAEIEEMEERIDKLEKSILTLVEANNNTFL